MSTGVAVIGAGMAGRAHAAAHRIAPTLYRSILPPVRLVSIADVSPELGALAARRVGYERSNTSWLAALRIVDPGMWVDIEHEDTSLGRIEGLEVAPQVLLDANRRAGIRQRPTQQPSLR